jgi:hypothetical protein
MRPDGGLFTRLAFVLVQPFQVQLHLAFVRGFETAQLEFNGHQAAKAAVVEQQIQVEVVTVNDHALLALYKGKAPA